MWRRMVLGDGVIVGHMRSISDHILMKVTRCTLRGVQREQQERVCLCCGAFAAVTLQTWIFDGLWVLSQVWYYYGLVSSLINAKIMQIEAHAHVTAVLSFLALVPCYCTSYYAQQQGMSLLIVIIVYYILNIVSHLYDLEANLSGYLVVRLPFWYWELLAITSSGVSRLPMASIKRGIPWLLVTKCSGGKLNGCA